LTELALPLVVRIERDDPPTRTDALEAAARAVLFMLTTEDDEWRPAVEAWDGQRIRKVVRRARGAAWQRAGELPCLSIEHGTAEVRVYPPVPVDDWPPDLAKLQVGGTELDDPEPPEAPPPGDPLILLSPHARMSAGKAMAQAGHAAQLGWRAASRRRRAAWADTDFALSVRTASAEGWRRALELNIPVVHDGGFTEVEPNTMTAAILIR
jgi:peptidyl-tRNA hydrolase